MPRGISHRIIRGSFRELSAICKEIPSISAITKRMNVIDINLKVIETPGGNGVQVEYFADSLRNNCYIDDIDT